MRHHKGNKQLIGKGLFVLARTHCTQVFLGENQAKEIPVSAGK
jgi:hypothetical protein